MNPVLRPSALAALLAVAFAAPVAAQDLGAVPAGTYKSDPTHAYVDFSYNHLGLSNPRCRSTSSKSPWSSTRPTSVPPASR